MQKRETTINERRYQMLTPSVDQAMPLCARTASLLAPTMAAAGAMANKEGWGSLANTLQSVDALKVNQLLKDAMSVAGVCYNNQPVYDMVSFEKHFDQLRQDVYPVGMWALWECVRDFFPDWAAYIQTFMAAGKAALSKSQTDGKPMIG